MSSHLDRNAASWGQGRERHPRGRNPRRKNARDGSSFVYGVRWAENSRNENRDENRDDNELTDFRRRKVL